MPFNFPFDFFNQSRVVGTPVSGNTINQVPVPNPVSNTSLDIFGMNPYSFATIAARLASALAPERYNRWGQRVPSWQEKLAEQAFQIGRGKMVTDALKAQPTTGGVNPMLLYLLSSGGGI